MKSLASRAKVAAKTWLKSIGVHLYTDRSLPTSVDWLHDIQRLNLLGPNPICLDVGANVGQTVVELRSAFAASEIHAFEPFQATFNELKARCGAMTRIHLVPCAMGAQPGITVAAAAQESVRSSLNTSVTTQTATTETIKIDSVDRYCADRGIERIDILKSDTEGYDLEVLKGADEFLRTQRVGFVFVEVSFEPAACTQTSAREVLDRMEAHDYRFIGLYDSFGLQYFSPPDVFCNLLFVSRRLLNQNRRR